MATIGRVRKEKDGSYVGNVQTLSMDNPIGIKVTPIKAPKKSEKHPDFLITARGNSEVGAGWNKKNTEDGSTYTSLTLEAPEFGDKVLYCNLGKAPDSKDGMEFNLIWNGKKAWKPKNKAPSGGAPQTGDRK